MKKYAVLLIEDDKLIRDSVRQNLDKEGYDVITAGSAHELTDKLADSKFDIVLLDLVLPDADGLTLIAKIRERSEAPIIVISSKSEMIDKVIALEMGADDYVSKPLPMKELSSRIKAHLRRDSRKPANDKSGQTEQIRFRNLLLDSKRIQVFDEKGKSCKLTVRQFRLLEAMARNPDRVMSREQLLDKSGADNFDINDRSIDVQILRIRKKIGDTGKTQIIQSVRGAGYIFVSEAGAKK